MIVDRLRDLVTWATLASLGLAGCAPLPEYCRTSASVDGMVAAEAAMWRGRAPALIARNIEVTLATGGEDAGGLFMWAWEVSNENLRQALERSLDIAELRAPPAQRASYRLEASLLGLDPSFPATVTSTIDYKLSPMSQGRTLQTVVVTTYSESFWGGCGSFQLASESAIRENIRSFIEQLVEFYGK